MLNNCKLLICIFIMSITPFLTKGIESPFHQPGLDFFEKQRRQNICNTLVGMLGGNTRLDCNKVIQENVLSLRWKIQTKPESEQIKILEFVSQMSWLTHLDLFGNYLSKLPPEIGNLQNLTHLDIESNNLEELPETLSNLGNLTDLNLGQNKLKSLPLSLTRLTKLTQLYVNNNMLESLPEDIGNLTKLTQLGLAFNKLRKLPNSIGQLIELIHITLEYNLLERLPDSLTRLRKVTRLDLRHNKLEKLPKTIGDMNQLTELVCENNNLIEIPETISSLYKLSFLTFENNQLRTLPATLGTMTNLRQLFLENNQLEILPVSLGQLTALETLNLNNNNLITLPPQIGRMIRLRDLRLNSNPLTTIPAAIGDIPTLTYIRMENLPNFLMQGESPDEWGRQELLEYFGDRVIGLRKPKEQNVMPENTTKESIYRKLDERFIRINRPVFVENRLPNITVDHVFTGEEMLEVLTRILTSLNFTDPSQSAYMEYKTLANDYGNDARNSTLTNIDKIWTFLAPRLTGYFRTLYSMPLEERDVPGWKMYPDQIEKTKLALTYIMDHIERATDPDLKISLFYQLVNGLLHCPTGQSEGINTIAFALLENRAVIGDFVTQIKSIMALKKNSWFATAILARATDNEQNVHIISFYRDKIKNDLGLLSPLNYTERMRISGFDPFHNNPANVLAVYYELVTTNSLVSWIMNQMQTQEDLELISAQRLLEANSPSLSKPIDGKFWGHFIINQGLVTPQKLMKDTEHIASKHLPGNWWATWFTGNPLQAKDTSFTKDGWLTLLQFIKSKIKSNKQFRPLTHGNALRYMHENRLIDTTQPNWWKDLFNNDPTLDETATITRQGIINILINMGFIIDQRHNNPLPEKCPQFSTKSEADSMHVQFCNIL